MFKKYKVFAAALALAVLASFGVAVAQVAPPPLRPIAIAVDSGTKTATATAGAATLNKNSGVVTSEALSTAAAASYTLTITNSQIAATDIVMASVAFGTSTTGEPIVSRVTPGAGSVAIVVRNSAAAAALNGTIKVSFVVFKN